MPIEFLSQVKMDIPATQEYHLINQKELQRRIKEPCRLVCTTNFDADYNTALQTLTQKTNDLVMIDGEVVQTNDRILFTNQDNAILNGIYTLVNENNDTSSCTFKRSTDMDITDKLIIGSQILITDGVVYSGSLWALTTNNPTLGENLTFINLNKSSVLDLSDELVDLVNELNGTDS